MQNPDIHEGYDIIASDKVEGTKVYDPNGDHIGSIERLMLEKRGGRVAYAVLSFGGFLGMGQDHYPIPWEKLAYDESVGGYRVNISRDQIEGAPKYSGDNYEWSSQEGRRVYDYYGVQPYW